MSAVRCQECKSLRTKVSWAEGDLHALRRSARRLERSQDEDAQHRNALAIKERKADAAEAQAHLEAHIADDHEGAPPVSGRNIMPRDRPAKVETRPRCGVCGQHAAETSTGRLWAHRASDGMPCPNRRHPDAQVVHISTPPVVIAQRTPTGRVSTLTRERNEPSRLDAGSNCVDCGKWLPGERSVCGRCSVKRAKR